MKIWLDDNCENADTDRLTPEGWIGVKNFFEFRRLIEQAVKTGEPIEMIDFDNDLGERPGRGFEVEGREILKWLKRKYPQFVVGEGTELRTHSANPEANRRMQEDIAFWRAHPGEVLAEKNRPNPFGEIVEPDGKSKIR